MLVSSKIFAPAYVGFTVLLYLFYPLAGCLANIKCGRYKLITNSLWFIIWDGVFTIVGSIIIAWSVYSSQNDNITANSKCNCHAYWLSTSFGATCHFQVLYHSVPISFSLVSISFMTLPQRILYSMYISLYLHHTWVQQLTSLH